MPRSSPTGEEPTTDFDAGAGAERAVFRTALRLRQSSTLEARAGWTVDSGENEFVSAQWDDPGHILLNVVSMAFLAVVLLLIVRAPADWLGGSRWAKAGWAVFAVGLTSVINGVYLPVGAAVALWRLGRGRRSDAWAKSRFPCGSNIPGPGVRCRTSWPLAELVITEAGLRVDGRGLLRRLGGEDTVCLHDVTSAQALTSRFGGGVCIDVRDRERWYIFTFRPERVLEALTAIGVQVIPGARRIRMWDQM